MLSCDKRGIVGCLNYLALTTRPDIAHRANTLSLFVENPMKERWRASISMSTLLEGYKV